MSVVALPAAIAASIGGQTWGRISYETLAESDVTGAVDIATGAPPRWTCSLQSKRALNLVQAGQWDALLLRLGRSNHLAVYDLLRAAPQGTLRGTPKLAAAVAVGATSMTLTNAVGTLKAGDALQIGTGLGSSQLVKVLDDVSSTVLVPTTATWFTSTPAAATWTTASAAAATWSLGGTVTVTFQSPARYAWPAGTVLAWDKPVAYMRVTTNRIAWTAKANGPAIEGYDIDLIEQW